MNSPFNDIGIDYNDHIDYDDYIDYDDHTPKFHELNTWVEGIVKSEEQQEVLFHR